MSLQDLHDLPGWFRLLGVFWPVLALLGAAWAWYLGGVWRRRGQRVPNPARTWWDENDDDSFTAGPPPGGP